MTTERAAGLREPRTDAGQLLWRYHDCGWLHVADIIAIEEQAALLDARAAVDVERLARAMDIADPPMDGGVYEDEDHAEHLAYAKEIADIYARADPEP